MITLTGYKPSLQNLAYFNKANPTSLIDYHSCRETFFSKANYAGIKENGILFSIAPEQKEDLINLIKNVETALKLKTHSVVNETNFDNTIHIDLAVFWTRYLHRVHFFTALLKTNISSFLVNKKDDNLIENLIASNRYFVDCAPAVRLFFQDYRVPTPQWELHYNWQSRFRNVSESNVLTYLKKPKHLSEPIPKKPVKVSKV